MENIEQPENELNINDPEFVPKLFNSFTFTRLDNIVVFNFFYETIPSKGKPIQRKLVGRLATTINGARKYHRLLSVFLGETLPPIGEGGKRIS